MAEFWSFTGVLLTCQYFAVIILCVVEEESTSVMLSLFSGNMIMFYYFISYPNKHISQIPQCIRYPTMPHIVTEMCTRCAHFCYKMLHCGIWHRCIQGIVRWVYTRLSQVANLKPFFMEYKDLHSQYCVCWWPNRRQCIKNHVIFHPLRTKFFSGNKNISLNFMSFLHIHMSQVVEILSNVRQELTYST